MSVSILRPSATSANTGALTGGATAHAVLADDSDSSYITLDPGETFEVGLQDFSQPAGSVIVYAQVRLRIATNTNAGVSVVDTTLLGETAGTAINWLSPTTVAVLSSPHDGSVDDTDLDGATLVIANSTIVAPIDGVIVVYEAYLDVYYAAKPVVDAVAPTGTIDTNLPEISWEDTLDSLGGPQTRYEVKIFTDAQYGAGGFNPASSTPFDTSGEVAASDTAWTPDDALPEDTYRAYVRVAQTPYDGAPLNWSDRDYTQFTVDVLVPGDPTISADGAPLDGRLEITVDDTAGETATTHFQVQRSIDAGATWSNVRTDLGGGLVATSGPAVTVYDYEAPNGADVLYRARAYSEAELTYSGWVASDSTLWESTATWIKSASDPGLNMAVVISSQSGYRRPVRQAIQEPLGREDPVVISDVRPGERGDIVFMVEDADDRDNFEALLDTLEPLLIQTPSDQQWRDRWVMLGDLEANRFSDTAWSPEGLRGHSWIEVTAP